MPASSDLANRFANTLARHLRDNPSFRFPAFVHEIAQAHLDYMNGVPNAVHGPYYIDATGDDPSNATLFHFLYRRGRAYILDADGDVIDPNDLTTQAEMRSFHQQVVFNGIQTRGTIGPHGNYLAAFLLYFINNSTQYTPMDNIGDPDCACQHCGHGGWQCTTVFDTDGATLLGGRCIACWYQGRRDCSFGKASFLR